MELQSDLYKLISYLIGNNMKNRIFTFKRGLMRLAISLFILVMCFLTIVSVFGFIVYQLDSKNHHSNELFIFFLASIGLSCVVTLFHPLVVVIPVGIITACLILWVVGGFFVKRETIATISNRKEFIAK